MKSRTSFETHTDPELLMSLNKSACNGARPTASRDDEFFSSHDDPKVAAALAAYLAEVEAGRRPSRKDPLDHNQDIALALADCLDVVDFVHSATAALSSDDSLPFRTNKN